MVRGQLAVLPVSLLTLQTDQHGHRPKKSYFSSACEYVKLPFSLRVPKIIIYYTSFIRHHFIARIAIQLCIIAIQLYIIYYLHNLWWQDNYCDYHLRCPAAY
jgi:hypothetical protein